MGQHSKTPGNFSVLLARSGLVAHSLEQQPQVGRVDHQVLVETVSYQFAVAE
jgi:hypothetical protein